MSVVAAAILTAAVSSPVSAQVDLDGSFPPDAPVSFIEMHRLVSAGFLDPLSAQYRGMVHQISPLVPGHEFTRPTLCGWVNAKNQMGGYGALSFFVIEFDRPDGIRTMHFAPGSQSTPMIENLGCDVIDQN
jgi:hypothetical protein|tara:strand:+ start:55983 stop:56375 length:393 start_codon:yes stop_codon:yes gene_type:complete